MAEVTVEARRRWRRKISLDLPPEMEEAAQSLALFHGFQRSKASTERRLEVASVDRWTEAMLPEDARRQLRRLSHEDEA